MRLLHWYPNMSGGGGVARALLALALHQARLGASVAVAMRKDSGEALYEPVELEGVAAPFEWRPHRRIRVGKRLSIDFIDRRDVERLVGFQPDVVHVHGEYNLNNLWVRRLFKCPIVLSPHGVFHPCLFQKAGRVGRLVYFHVARRMLYEFVARFHALSPMEADHIRKLLPSASIHCIPQGPSLSSIREGGCATPAREDGCLRLIFVGRLDVYTKGLDILLEGLAGLRGSVDAQRLSMVLVGPDWNGGEAWLRRRTRELGIDRQVVFTGPLAGSGVADALEQSDIYIQLSRNEGFPLSIAEALLMGKPVIMSRAIGTASYPEVASLPHVRVVDPHPHEAAKAIVDSARRLIELRQAAAGHRESLRAFFSWDRVAKLHIQMYEGIIRGEGITVAGNSPVF